MMIKDKKAQMERLATSFLFMGAIVLVIILIAAAESGGGFITSALDRFTTRCGVNCSALTLFFVQSLPTVVIGFLLLLGFVGWRVING